MIINMSIQQKPQQTITTSRSYYYTSYSSTAYISSGRCTMTFPSSAYSQSISVSGVYYVSSSNQRVFGENRWDPAIQQISRTDATTSVSHSFGTGSVIAYNPTSGAQYAQYTIFYRY